MQELIDLARATSLWAERSVSDVEEELLALSIPGNISTTLSFHIRYRIDLYNYYNWIQFLGPDKVIIFYHPINIQDTFQHKYVLLSLLQMARNGYPVVLSYHSSSFDFSCVSDELVTSTLDTYFMAYLNYNPKVRFSSVTRFIYSAGKSKATLDSIFSEYSYQKIAYSRENEIRGLLRGSIPLEQIPATKYDSNIKLFSASLANSLNIGWFPSIKDCSVINITLINELLSVLQARLSIRLIVGVHPHLSIRSPQKYKLIQSLYGLDDQKRLLYTELIDSAILIDQTQIVIGDVGSTLWDARYLGKTLLLMRDTDTATYDERLLLNHCYWEWYYGRRFGRLNPADLKSRLLQMSEVVPQSYHYV